MNENTDQRSSLLHQLRIDRDEPAARSRRRWPWLTAFAVLAVAGGAAAWYLSTSPGAVLVAVATAEPAPQQADGGGRGSALDASGYIVARRQATVSSKITGKVVSVLVEEGQHVKANQVVARLDDTNARAQVALASAQHEEKMASLEAAQVALDNAGPTFERSKKEYASGVTSAQAFDGAKTAYDKARMGLAVAERAADVAEASLKVARRHLDDTVVRAPFAGVVTVKAAQEGEMISPVSAGGGFTRTGVCTIVDMSSLEVDVDVSENFINRVHPNQKVSVRLNAYPDWVIPAHVIAIVPTADRAKATVPVRIAMEKTDSRILPEMGVRVSFLDDADAKSGARSVQRAVVVPAKAVQADGDTGVVYVIADHKIERRKVRLGARSADGQVVLSGLRSGARLAVGDFSRLTDGTRVRVAD